MRNKILIAFILISVFVLIDFYFFQIVVSVSKNWSATYRKIWRFGFWIPTALFIVVVLWWALGLPFQFSASARNFIITGIIATYLSKIIGIVLLFIGDIQRLAIWVLGLFKSSGEGLSGKLIPRSEFLSKAALLTTTIPFSAFAYGIISGAHDYRVKRLTISLPNLPKAFHGIRIGQISDIHSGSFWNKSAVIGGVNLFLKEKPDVIFFTGDLVNNETSEINDYLSVFNKIKAPYGVFSVTGNHDYGDYRSWASPEEKSKNFQDLIEAHKLLGYDLLMNENRILTIGSDQIAILGNENWGAGRFSKYGKLDLAYQGTTDLPVKLLLSHDPTHWDAQVRPLHPDIDITFSGHTHGFQFGVKIGGFRWSPAKYMYKQWEGLYQEGSQFLYVNRGFGFIGYPGRFGMPPELTIIELIRA